MSDIDWEALTRKLFADACDEAGIGTRAREDAAKIRDLEHSLQQTSERLDENLRARLAWQERCGQAEKERDVLAARVRELYALAEPKAVPETVMEILDAEGFAGESDVDALKRIVRERDSYQEQLITATIGGGDAVRDLLDALWANDDELKVRAWANACVLFGRSHQQIMPAYMHKWWRQQAVDECDAAHAALDASDHTTSRTTDGVPLADRIREALEHANRAYESAFGHGEWLTEKLDAVAEAIGFNGDIAVDDNLAKAVRAAVKSDHVAHVNALRSLVDKQAEVIRAALVEMGCSPEADLLVCARAVNEERCRLRNALEGKECLIDEISGRMMANRFALDAALNREADAQYALEQAGAFLVGKPIAESIAHLHKMRDLARWERDERAKDLNTEIERGRVERNAWRDRCASEEKHVGALKSTLMDVHHAIDEAFPGEMIAPGDDVNLLPRVQEVIRRLNVAVERTADLSVKLHLIALAKKATDRLREKWELNTCGNWIGDLNQAVDHIDVVYAQLQEAQADEGEQRDRADVAEAWRAEVCDALGVPLANHADAPGAVFNLKKRLRELQSDLARATERADRAEKGDAGRYRRALERLLNTVKPGHTWAQTLAREALGSAAADPSGKLLEEVAEVLMSVASNQWYDHIGRDRVAVLRDRFDKWRLA